MLRCTQPFNLSGHPAISHAVRHARATGLPVGLQLVGRKGRTPALVQAALAAEAGSHRFMIADYFHRWEQRARRRSARTNGSSARSTGAIDWIDHSVPSHQ